MNRQMLLGLRVMLAIGLVLTSTGGDAKQNPGDPHYEKIQTSRAQFLKRLAEWREYCDKIGSSNLEPYVDNDAFRKLVDLGPVAIPWLLNEAGVLKYTGMDMLHCDWKEMAGIRVDERGRAVDVSGKRVDVFAQFDLWWKGAANELTQTVEGRMATFRKVLQGKPKTTAYKELQGSHEWKMLRNTGLFGIPCVIKRVIVGQGDEYDFRLLTYWTDPLKPDLGGVPRVPVEKAVIPEAKSSSGFWVKWWQANAWQFWWLPAVDAR